MMDFSQGAGQETGSGLIPKNALLFANLTIRGVKASNSGGGYLDAELTIDAGQPYAGRKLWEMIGDPMNQGNSEKYRKMGQIAIARILEVGRGAGPHNPDAYKITGYEQLSGLRVAIKVGVDEGENGNPDKNRVGEWLTPNPQSAQAKKLWDRLMAGDHNLAQPQTATPSAPAATGGFGGAALSGAFGGAAPQPQHSAFGGGFGNQPVAPGNGFGNAPTPPATPTATPGWLGQAGGQAESFGATEGDVPY